MRWLLFLFAIGFSFLGHTQDKLSPKEMRQDFRQFKRQLFKQNKGVNLFISSKDYKAYLADIDSQLNEEKTPREFFQLIRKACIPVKEGHLEVLDYGVKTRGQKKNREFIFDEKRKYFPLKVVFTNDSTVYVVGSQSETDEPAELRGKLLSINGRKMKTIRDSLANHLVVDPLPSENSRKNYIISRAFSKEYFLHIDTSSVFNVEWLDEHKKKHLDTIEGCYPNERQNLNFNNNGESKFIDSLSAAYLDINSFKEWGSENSVYQKLNDFFMTVDNENTKHVIIDLRNNSGGYFSSVFYLLSFIQDKLKGYAYHQKFRVRLFNKIKLPFWRTKKVNTSLWAKNQRFKGDLYLLVNEGSYSATILTAILAKQYHSKTLIIGQPVGGRTTGTSAGTRKAVVLNNSGVLVKIPQMVLSYKQDVDITPDVLVYPKLEDYFSEDSDAILEKTLEIIRKKQSNEN